MLLKFAMQRLRNPCFFSYALFSLHSAFAFWLKFALNACEHKRARQGRICTLPHCFHCKVNEGLGESTSARINTEVTGCQETEMQTLKYPLTQTNLICTCTRSTSTQQMQTWRRPQRPLLWSRADRHFATGGVCILNYTQLEGLTHGVGVQASVSVTARPSAWERQRRLNGRLPPRNS